MVNKSSSLVSTLGHVTSKWHSEKTHGKAFYVE